MAIAWLSSNSNSPFPPIEQATKNGLLAAGGDLKPERLLEAYRHGIFPWFNQNDPILWWSPDPRMVLMTHDVHISKNLAKTIRKRLYRITIDQAFCQVMASCAAPRTNQTTDPDNQTWIHEDMIEAYKQLHDLGYAHSVECWQGDKLVGGLYGVAIGTAFFGESMFSFVSDSSKIALVTLCQQLERWGMPMIDCQVHSDHLSRMGAVEISRSTFLTELNQLSNKPLMVSDWKLDKDLPIA